MRPSHSGLWFLFSQLESHPEPEGPCPWTEAIAGTCGLPFLPLLPTLQLPLGHRNLVFKSIELRLAEQGEENRLGLQGKLPWEKLWGPYRYHRVFLMCTRTKVVFVETLSFVMEGPSALNYLVLPLSLMSAGSPSMACLGSSQRAVAARPPLRGGAREEAPALGGSGAAGEGAKETPGGFLSGTAALSVLVRICCRLILVCLQHHHQSQRFFGQNSLPCCLHRCQKDREDSIA